MSVDIRSFKKSDVPLKVQWINNPENNKYLHYDLPLIESKTYEWFDKLSGRENRIDLTITYEGVPVGLIGLLNIENGFAEYYICLGETSFKGRGIARNATKLLLEESYYKYGLKQIYLFTEIKNYSAQTLFERIGFCRDDQVDNNLIYNGKYISRYYYKLDLKTHFNKED